MTFLEFAPIALAIILVAALGVALSFALRNSIHAWVNALDALVVTLIVIAIGVAGTAFVLLAEGLYG